MSKEDRSGNCGRGCDIVTSLGRRQTMLTRLLESLHLCHDISSADYNEGYSIAESDAFERAQTLWHKIANCLSLAYIQYSPPRICI